MWPNKCLLMGMHEPSRMSLRSQSCLTGRIMVLLIEQQKIGAVGGLGMRVIHSVFDAELGLLMGHLSGNAQRQPVIRNLEEKHKLRTCIWKSVTET